MDNHHAYYSEYSVESWISFLLNGEIKLPPYQRHFVWSLQKSYNLVNAVLDGNFIPPIVIASTQHDLAEIPKGIFLIDGQQRLTSLLLFLLGVWPNEQSSESELNTENDEDNDSFVLNWTFGNLSDEYKKHTSFPSFVAAIQNSSSYIKFSELRATMVIPKALINDADALYDKISGADKKCFFIRTLGYSFVKSFGDVESEKRLFANLFRDINSTGQKLLPAESRQAMYYLEPSLKPLFQPPFLSHYRIGKSSIDFTRYLSYVDELHTQYGRTRSIPSTSSIAVGYSNKPEDYIVNYLVNMINNRVTYGLSIMENMDLFETHFKKVFKLGNSISDIQYFEIHVYGLIFWVLFEGKRLDESKLQNLDQKLTRWMEKKNDTNKRVGGIRNRLAFSVESYREVLIPDA